MNERIKNSYVWALDATAIAEFASYEEAISALDEQTDQVEVSFGGRPLILNKYDIVVMPLMEFYNL